MAGCDAISKVIADLARSTRPSRQGESTDYQPLYQRICLWMAAMPPSCRRHARYLFRGHGAELTSSCLGICGRLIRASGCMVNYALGPIFSRKCQPLFSPPVVIGQPARRIDAWGLRNALTDSDWNALRTAFSPTHLPETAVDPLSSTPCVRWDLVWLPDLVPTPTP